MSRLEFRALGPLEVVRDGEPVAVGPGRPRALLAYLLVNANEVVPAERLIEDLWHGAPPSSASHAIQVYVSALRRVLEPDRQRGLPPQLLITRAPGYVLVADAGSYDVHRFVSLVGEGQTALDQDHPEEASSLLARALDLWRGPAVADVADEPWAVAEAVRLQELRLAATERLAEADLALGRHAELVSELERLVGQHPFRERLWAHLMLALYRSGRQTEALRCYQRVRRVLGDELGLDPGPELRELEARVLQQDPELDARVSGRSVGMPTDVAPPVTSAPREDESVDVGGAVEEVRLVTALVADLVDSTSLADGLEPDELSLVMQGAMDRMAACIEALDGAVVDRSTTGVAALFGTPVAHEDDTQRAILAALQLRREVEVYGDDVSRSWNVEHLRARVGIDTGTVLIPPGVSRLGDAVSTAALLKDAAPPGAVLVSRATRRLVPSLFEWGGIEPVAVGEEGRVVEAAQVHGESSRSGRPDGFGGRPIPLVGRERELGEARRSIDAVLTGTGGVLIITAEAGHGKSRLLQELRAQFEGELSPGGRPLWLEGRCLSWGESLTYWPFRELLRDWLGASPTHPALRTRVSLQRKVDELFGADAAQVAAVLGDLLGLPLERDAAALLSSIPRQSIRPVTFGALRSLLERLAARGPVIVALDDVHWADTTSLAAIDHLQGATDAGGLLLILTMRPEHHHGSWSLRETVLRQRPQRTREVVLGPLTEGLDLRMLDVLVGPGVLPPPVARHLLDVADGNPLFIEELARSLVDNGSLTLDEGGWHFQRMVPQELPTTIEQVLAGRIDRVPGPTRAVLAAAAVLGRQFDIDVLTTVCRSDPPVEVAVADLEESRLLLQVRRWPRPEYRFCHPLMAEAAYRRLAGDRRRDLHRRAASAIETLFPDRQAENYAVLAFHYERAGEAESALTYHRLAGDDARAAHALDEALTHYSAAMDLLDSVASDVASKLRAPLHLGRGYAWWQLADRRAGPELRQALAFAAAGGDLTTELEALELLSVVEGLAGGNLGLALDRLDQALQVARAAGDVAAEVTVRNRRTVALANRLDLRRAFESGHAALGAARGAGDERLVARAMDGLKLVAFILGDFSTLESLTGELQTVLRGRNDRRYLQYVLAEGSFASAARGDWDGARRRLGDAQAMNTQLGNRFDSPYILTLRAWLERTQGAYGLALRLAQKAAAAAREQENGQWVAWSEANLGAILLELGVVADALPHLGTAKAAAQRGSFQVQLVRATALAAVARLHSGDGTSHLELEAAERLLRDATTPDGWAEPVFLYGLDAYLAVATIRAIRGDIGAAEALLVPVLSAAERVGWIEGMARTQLALAKCSAGYGAWDRASAAVDGALDLTQGQLPPVEWRVHAARAQVLAVGGDDQRAEAERRVARSIVLGLASSLEEPALGSRFLAWAMDVVDERALDLWP